MCFSRLCFDCQLPVPSTAYCVVVDCRLLSAIVLVSIDTRDKSNQKSKQKTTNHTQFIKGQKQGKEESKKTNSNLKRNI